MGRRKKKKTPKPEEKYIKINLECRNCGTTATILSVDDKNIDVGIKAIQCSQCGKWGNHIATYEKDGKSHKWAVLNYHYDEKTGKRYFLDEKSNNDDKLKKILYRELSKKERGLKTPFKGINNPRNWGINSEFEVDSNLKPLKK